jgi:spermidine synthase
VNVREHIGSAMVPGGEELRLFRRGRDFAIWLRGNELMSTRMSGSEEALARMTCARLGKRPAPHLLIGGYGMGFTLRAALEELPKEARLTVAELVPEIVTWARGPMQDLTAGCLDDRRVVLKQDDVANLIASARGSYDAILLDVDNGPEGLVRPGNDRIYSDRGLRSAKVALRPEGILAVWSATGDPRFTARLRQAGFSVDEVRVAARTNGKGPRHVIWFARVP